MQDFEGYLDILAYLHRDLPEKPDPVPDGQTPSPQPEAGARPQESVHPPPREQDWIASGTHSRVSTLSDDDELRRRRSRSAASGLLSRATSASAKTVTPMSSVESDKGLRGNTKAPPAVAPSIAEVSEPDTSSPSQHSVPRRGSGIMPLVCCHCGRDPSERNTAPEVHSRPETILTVIEVPEAKDLQAKALAERAVGPSISARDDLGQRYRLYPQTSYYEVMTAEENELDAATTTSGRRTPFEFSKSVLRLSPADPDAVEALPTPHLPDRDEHWEMDSEAGDDVYEDAEDMPRAHPPSAAQVESSPYKRPSNPNPYDAANSAPNRLAQACGAEEAELPPPSSSFWKNAEGVILVYQGVEVNGEETFYGNEISYLGSYYDDDEGSSGLGSKGGSFVDLGAAGSGLAVIPEGGSSD